MSSWARAAGGVALLVGAAPSDGLLAAVDAEVATDKLTANLGLIDLASADRRNELVNGTGEVVYS